MHKESRMSICNSALFLATCAVIGTGLMLEFRLDDDQGSFRLFGISADDWGEAHFVIALIFIALLVAHCILHKAWIKMKLQQQKFPALCVLAVGLLLAATLLVWPRDDRSALSANPHEVNKGCDE